MKFLIRPSGEKVNIKDLPTAEILDNVAFFKNLLGCSRSTLMQKAYEKALRVLNRELKKRNLF